MNYIYHRVPLNRQGSTLYPLNVLKRKLPELYTIHAKKYVGREALTQQIIPPLGCLWNDVLHFSPVHPDLIRQGLATAGAKPKSMQWFQVDPLALNFNVENAAIYQYPSKVRGDFAKNPEDFEAFAPHLLAAIDGLPMATINHYRSSQTTGNPLFLFHRLPHVLYRGSLPIENMTIIES